MSLRVTFAGQAVDRAAERRTDAAWLEARREDPGTRVVRLVRGGVHLDGDRLRRDGPEALRGAAESVFLGLEDGHALFATASPDPEEGAAGLREAAALLSEDEAGLAAEATAVLNWHRTHPRCARCGTATDSADGGWIRRCPQCGAQHHPRTDPVVIMLVTDGDRALLGRQRTWPPGRYSALAGFVEPGESLEDAVAREVAEEARVRVRDVRYLASQPWPFPSSLMVGFLATWDGGEPQVGDAELEDVRWFTRDELQQAVREDGPIGVPPPLAIARRLIDHWLAG